MTNTQIAEAFSKGATEGKSGTMFIEGDTIYSYGYHFPIATRINDNLYLFNKDRYSHTTGRHKFHVLQAISSGLADVIECPATDGTGWGRKSLKMDLGYTMQEARTCLDKANRTRTDHMYKLWRDMAWDYDAQAQAIREYIKDHPGTLYSAYSK